MAITTYAELGQSLGEARYLRDGEGVQPTRSAKLWGEHLWLPRAGVALHIDGCDVSPTAVEFAAGRARRAGADVRFFAADALRDPLPDGYDAVVCSLFLHHLADDEAEGFRLLTQPAASGREARPASPRPVTPAPVRCTRAVRRRPARPGRLWR